MPLATSRPWKHPDSGVYWFRRAVPADLREVVSKREEKQSLKTKDAALAKQHHAQLLSEVEARWANLRQGPRSLSEAEANAIAAARHDRWIELHRDNPAEQTWPTSLREAMWKGEVVHGNTYMTDQVRSHLQELQAKIRNAENWCRAKALKGLAERGLVVDDAARLKVAKAIGYAVQRASLTLAEYAKGNYGLRQEASNFMRRVEGCRSGARV